MSVEAKNMTFMIDSNAFKILKEIPEVHRNSFIHLAIMNSVGSDFHKKMITPTDDEFKQMKEAKTESASPVVAVSSWDSF